MAQHGQCLFLFYFFNPCQMRTSRVQMCSEQFVCLRLPDKAFFIDIPVLLFLTENIVNTVNKKRTTWNLSYFFCLQKSCRLVSLELDFVLPDASKQKQLAGVLLCLLLSRNSFHRCDEAGRGFPAVSGPEPSEAEVGDYIAEAVSYGCSAFRACEAHAAEG